MNRPSQHLARKAIPFFLILAGSMTCQLADAQLARTQDSALVEMARIQASRLAAATPVTLISPYFSIRDLDETRLYLLNSFSDPLEVDVTAISPTGIEVPLGRFAVEVTSHTALSLRELLSAADSQMHSGSLRVAFFGDPNMLQAWAVRQKGKQVTEWPLENLGNKTSTLLSSFWDTRPLGDKVHPEFMIVNSQAAPVAVTITLGQGTHERTRQVLQLAAGTTHQIDPLADDPAMKHGWIRVETPGDPGSLSGIGFLSSPEFLSRLDLETPSAIAASHILETVRIPLASPKNASGRTIVTLFNDSARPAQAALVVMGSSGAEIQRIAVPLAPRAVVTRRLLEGFTAPPASVPQGARLRIVAPDGKVRGQVLSISADGAALDVALFRQSEAHQSGLYPLPSLDNFEVFTTMVNLGTEASEIAAHIFWSDGSYALPEIVIPAGAAHRLVIHDVVQDEVPDLLGRFLDPGYEAGFLQWTVRRGSHQVIARTEATPKGSDDAFGFNCGNCCPETSFGGIIPSQVAFDIGQTQSFQGVEYIATCTATLGPFPANFTSFSYSYPVSWNGSIVSSSDLTNQTVSFSAIGERTRFELGFCYQEPASFFATGRTIVDKCLNEHAPGYDPSPAKGGCKGQSTSCGSCFTCCENVRQAQICSCTKLGQNCTESTKLSCRSCQSACLIKFDPSSCPGQLGCN